jgi:hypothetical protein
MTNECKLYLEHVKLCEQCYTEVMKWSTSWAGKSKSDKKAAAARENGKKGGRPKGTPNKRKEVTPWLETKKE